MSAAAVTRSNNKKNIRLKRIIQFNGSSSLGITLPRAFVKALNLKPGMFVSCESQNNDKTIKVEGVNIG